MTRPAALMGRRPLLVAAALAFLGIAASGALPGLIDALAYLLPPLLLLLALVARRYPGERALLALIGAHRQKRRRAAVAAARPVRPRATVPRGGLLIASSLAFRPPPAAATALS
jgi:hypothetical protein